MDLNKGFTLFYKQTRYMKTDLSNISVRRLNEVCDENNACTDALSCLNGTCRCSNEIEPTTSICLHTNNRLLGQYCNPLIDTCYHESGLFNQ